MQAVPRPGRRAVVELWDGRWWPCAGFFAERPVFRWRWAPTGLHTTRQLALEGLQPGGQDVVGWLAWGRPSWPRWAYLYRRDLAKPKRSVSPAQWEALAKATAARQARRCQNGHSFEGWWPCACEQAITGHQDGFFVDGSCAFEVRCCRYCPVSEERHVTADPAATVPNLVIHDWPGGSSAKTSDRAGSANHQNDSKETEQ